MGHRDLLVTHNLSDEEYHDCRAHPRGSVRRASGFVLTGKQEVSELLPVCRPSSQNCADHLSLSPTQQAGLHQAWPEDPPYFTRGMTMVGTSQRRETTCSISSHVVVRPRLKRMAPIPISGGTFIAFNTGESSTEPEWQAEPVEAATPSRPLKIVEPIFPTKLTFSVLGNLSVGWPFRTTPVPNRVCSSSQKRSRSWRIDSSASQDCASSQAAPRATSSRMFSVPARRPDS